MHSRRLVAILLIIVGGWCGYAIWSDQRASNERTALSGGETTVHLRSRKSFEMAASNLTPEELDKFQYGNRLFNTNWVIAPASVQNFDGLGPLFNRVSCSGCHFKDGRGRPPEPGEQFESMLLRLSVPGQDAHGGPLPHPVYGGQLQDRAIPGVDPEGTAVIRYEEIHDRYPDGTPYTLLKPTYEITGLAYGAMDGVLISPRVAPAVYGLGLLEAIPVEAMEALADPDDRNGDGISGRINIVWNAETKQKEPGRFGWKANQPDLRNQDAGAFAGDIGITSSIQPETDCTPSQTGCRNAINGGQPEIRDSDIDMLEFYSQTLAVPARRDMDDPQVIEGEELFSEIGCASCHTPKFKTGKHKVKAVANQTIHPYTDLLLHDMGEGLADGRPDFQATGSEWRTPPLWGIGLVHVVNKHSRFLHDGRARGLEEAILWHGGEAENAKEQFRHLSQEQRAAVIRFLESL